MCINSFKELFQLIFKCTLIDATRKYYSHYTESLLVKSYLLTSSSKYREISYLNKFKFKMPRLYYLSLYVYSNK